MSVNAISVIIADDHPIFLRGLRLVIETDRTLRVVGEAAEAVTALTLITQNQPCVAVLDVDMPGDGFSLARKVLEQQPETPVIFLTAHDDEAIFNAALELGVAGYVLKESAITDIINAIKTVAAGQNFITPRLASYLINRRARNPSRKFQLNDLSPAEQKVLRLIAAKKTTKEIAADLFISEHTVSRHRANICAKLNLAGINALLKFALEHQAELR
jgi:DNA-binding NarL/FixJ family response regulator